MSDQKQSCPHACMHAQTISPVHVRTAKRFPIVSHKVAWGYWGYGRVTLEPHCFEQKGLRLLLPGSRILMLESQGDLVSRKDVLK